MVDAPKKGSNRALGYAGESIACDHLASKGYEIICRNYTVKGGEIDIIAADERYVIFVEVKTRRAGYSIKKYGRGALSVNSSKKEHFLHAVKSYLRKFPSDKKPRIDVIEITLEEFDSCVVPSISHYENAFGDRRSVI